MSTGPEVKAIGRTTSSNSVRIDELHRTGRTNAGAHGTVTRYRVVTNDGIEREVIHGQALASRKPSRRSVDLTLDTAPPLSLGPEGMIMHLVFRTMARGMDAVVFGPERARQDGLLGEEEVRDVARRISFGRAAETSHLVADRLTELGSTDLRHMLWVGASLGAMKGIAFAALAPRHDRELAYSHFVVPVGPGAMPKPTPAELRLFILSETTALTRLWAELWWHDVRERTVMLHRNVGRLSRPGLMWRYGRMSLPRSEFGIFTEAWRDAVVSGEAGTLAGMLPTDRLTTFELFSKDRGGSPDEWCRALSRQVAAGTTRIDTQPGHHTDSLRLSHQRRRGHEIGRVIRAIQAGVPPAALEHPLGKPFI